MRLLCLLRSGEPSRARTLLQPWLDRPLEVVVAGDAAARNAALRGRDEAYVHFAGDPVEGSFLTLACRLLDRDPNVAFVTGWGDDPFGSVQRPCTPAMLLGRPFGVEAPAVFRRSLWDRLGGFDEQLGAGEDVDLGLRALAAGDSGAVVPVTPSWPGGEIADAAELRLLEKHRDLVEREAEEILVIKERWLRALAARTNQGNARRSALEAEQARLDQESARLEACLTRLRRVR